MLFGGGTSLEKAGGKSWGGTAAGRGGGPDDNDDDVADNHQLDDVALAGTSSDGEDEEGATAGRRHGKTPGVKQPKSRGGAKASLDMEVTFTPGLGDLGQKLLAKKKEADARKNDTVWQAYLRNKAEKRKARKAQGRKGDSSSSGDESDLGGGGSDEEHGNLAGQDPFFQHDEDPFDDPFFQVSEELRALTFQSCRLVCVPWIPTA